MKISFIIPVYNGESTLRQAVSFVQMGKEDETEILIVDDGSTDGTRKICDSLEAEDKRIRVVHTPNLGQGHARNIGIEQAAGEYLFFLDADDYAFWEGVQELKELARTDKFDIIYGTYRRTHNRVSKRMCENLKEGVVVRHGTKTETALYHQIKTEWIFGSAVGKLYRRDFLLEHQIRFPDDKRYYMEDQLFNLKAYAYYPRCYLKNSVTFDYNTDNASTTRRAETALSERIALMLSAYGRFLEKEGIAGKNLDLLVPLCMRCLCWAAYKNIEEEGADARLIQKRICDILDVPVVDWVLSDRKNRGYLKPIPSFPQRVFYSFCFYVVQKKRGKILADIFACLYPLMKWYVKLAVR